ncbi:MAG TPA: ABC transporter substrate-binding protein [Chloroflexota bacterium]
MTRREFLMRGAFGLLVLPLVGCGGPSGPVSTVPADVVRVALDGLEQTLDPHAWSTSSGPRTFAPMFDALTFIQSDGKLRPALALAWSQTTSTSWQFRLRVDDVRFHNGEAFTPESLRFTFDRLSRAKLPLSRLAERLDRIEVVNAATVSLVTKEPEPDLPRWLSAIYLVPPSYFGQAGGEGFARQPVGTGLWQLADFQATSHLHLSVFRDTWRNDRGATAPPVLKTLELEVRRDAAERAAALRTLDFDVATDLADPSSLQAAGL